MSRSTAVIGMFAIGRDFSAALPVLLPVTGVTVAPLVAHARKGGTGRLIVATVALFAARYLFCIAIWI